MTKRTNAFMMLWLLVPSLAVAAPIADAFETVTFSGGPQEAHNSDITNLNPSNVTMIECEGVNNCTTWTFIGKKGYGKWPTGEEAILEVQSRRGDEIVIERTDITGLRQGLTATYKGILKDDRVGGEYTSMYKGQRESGNWYWIIEKNRASVPGVLHLCTADLKNCLTLTFNAGGYDFSRNGVSGTYVILGFTQHLLVLKRTVKGRPDFYSINQGIISAKGNRVLYGDFSDSNVRSGHFTASWGEALAELPGETSVAGQSAPQASYSLLDWLRAAKTATEIYDYWFGPRN